MKRLRYEIKGMSCAACVSHVERAVRGLMGEGDQFTVSLLTNSITIMTEQDLTEQETEILEKRLSAAIKAAGYTLLTEEKRTAEKEKKDQKPLLILIISAIFTLAVMYLAMGGMIGLPIPKFLQGTENALSMAIVQLILTLPVLILNFKFFKNGGSALFHLSPNMDSLIAVGSGASVIYGIVTVFLLIGENDPTVIHKLMHDLYFESAAMILTLVSLGKRLESGAKDKAADAVKSLAKLSPKNSTVLRDGKEIVIPSEEICVGDLVLIRAGELIPVDGEVVFGEGTTDESALTGESMPVEKEKGSTVRAACVLTFGALTVRAKEVGENTSLSRIVRLLEDAAASKAPIARIADKVSSIFVPSVMAISLLTLITWLLITKNAEQAFRSAISVLVISCPCALGLATPTAVTVGIGRGAKCGILFRNAEALEKLSLVNTVVFDKTGTVTEGKAALTDIYSYGMSAEEMLSYAASVEKYSSHPLAFAVVRGGESMGLTMLDADKFQNLTGVGAQARVNGKIVRITKPDAFLREITEEAYTEKKEPKRIGEIFTVERRSSKNAGADIVKLEGDGKTAVVVTVDEKIVGVLGIADRIRTDSRDAVNALKTADVACLMLTGDNERAAAFVAQEANLDGYRASLMPEDKERMVAEFSRQGITAMVGDGINDAPALARADIGIAIGAGTEVAIESADVVISGASLSGVTEAFFLSRAAIRIIKQNLFWALFYNAVCIPVAAGVFYPLFGWQLSPMLASAAMSFSSVCVVSNALRLRKIPLSPKTKENNKKTKKQEGEEEMIFSKKKTLVVGVEGMMCQHCVAHVKKALEGVKGVSSVTVSLEEKNATVIGTASEDAIRTAVTEAGYTVTEVK